MFDDSVSTRVVFFKKSLIDNVQKLKKFENSNYMIKISRWDLKSVRFIWFFELHGFELKEFSGKVFNLKSEGTKESVRITLLCLIAVFNNFNNF